MGRILVTGGLGFIGTNLVRELRGRGHLVWTADLAHSESGQHMRADVGSFAQIERLFQGESFDYVYHLAAEYGRWNGEAYYETLWRTNTIGTKNILRLQERHRFRMIFFSSAEVYGDFDGVMSEDVVERFPIVQLNDYAIGKWAGEMQCMNAAAMHGTENVRVRPVCCYGPYERFSRYRGVIPVFVYHALTGERLVVHKGHRRIFDYVDDTCRTAANICENFRAGEVYNLGGSEESEVDIQQLAQVVIDATGAESRLIDVHKEEPFTTRIKRVDSSKARRELDHRSEVDLEEGIGRYVEWMRRTYKL